MNGQSNYRIAIQSAASSAQEASRNLRDAETWFTEATTHTLGGIVTDITGTYASRTMVGSPVQPPPNRYEWTLEVLALIPGSVLSERGSPGHTAAEFASQIQKFASDQGAEFRVEMNEK